MESFMLGKQSLKLEVDMIEAKVIEGFKRTCKYGPRVHPITKEVQNHNGIDFIGSDYALLSPFAGEIIESGSDDLSGYWGKVKFLIGIDVFVFSYCHLARPVAKALIGYKTEPLEWIFIEGNSGRSTGIHCHLTVRRNGEIVNPELYFKFI